MKHQFYLPHTDAGRALWLNNFYTKLLVYATALGISPATLTATQDGMVFYEALLAYMAQLKDYTKNLTSFKALLSSGTSAGTYRCARSPGYRHTYRS